MPEQPPTHQRTWKDWSAHPLPVIIASCVGLIAIFTFFTGKTNLYDFTRSLKEINEVKKETNSKLKEVEQKKQELNLREFESNESIQKENKKKNQLDSLEMDYNLKRNQLDKEVLQIQEKQTPQNKELANGIFYEIFEKSGERIEPKTKIIFYTTYTDIDNQSARFKVVFPNNPQTFKIELSGQGDSEIIENNGVNYKFTMIRVKYGDVEFESAGELYIFEEHEIAALKIQKV